MALTYRLSIDWIAVTRSELEAFRASADPDLTFDGKLEDHCEDWAANLYPDEIQERLRAGIARYVASTRS